MTKQRLTLNEVIRIIRDISCYDCKAGSDKDTRRTFCEACMQQTRAGDEVPYHTYECRVIQYDPHWTNSSIDEPVDWTNPAHLNGNAVHKCISDEVHGRGQCKAQWVVRDFLLRLKTEGNPDINAA